MYNMFQVLSVKTYILGLAFLIFSYFCNGVLSRIGAPSLFFPIFSGFRKVVTNDIHTYIMFVAEKKNNILSMFTSSYYANILCTLF